MRTITLWGGPSDGAEVAIREGTTEYRMFTAAPRPIDLTGRLHPVPTALYELNPETKRFEYNINGDGVV